MHVLNPTSLVWGGVVAEGGRDASVVDQKFTA